MSQELDAVAGWLVTKQNPPRYIDGMDYERCAALHNAIFKHGWVSSGRKADDFDLQARPWLELHPQVNHNDFHPSVVAFLREARALDLNHPVHFFYSVEGINIHGGHHLGIFLEDDQAVTLYSTSPAFATKQDGLVYDQGSHLAIMHFDLTDDLSLEQPWQKLECIFTVWIEMIQRQKVVALHDDIGRIDYVTAEDGNLRKIEGPERDPATGAKRHQDGNEPWTMVPWAAKDLEETLELWGKVVESIEQKMGVIAGEQSNALLDTGTLDAAHIPAGFTRELLSRARRPRFRFVAPGLQVPTKEDFTSQPFIDALRGTENDDMIPPIRLFCSDATLIATVSMKDLLWFRAFGYWSDTRGAECPCGLYLTPCQRSYRYPQEDGCSLILPFKFEDGWAKQSDFTAADLHDNLLQSGINPYNDGHPIQLQGFLENVYWNVKSGCWSVDENGVAGGLDKWKDADTEQGWSSYFVELGPGGYW